MRKPVFAYVETRMLVFSCRGSNVKYLAISCGCTTPFLSDLFGNPEDRLSHDAAEPYICQVRKCKQKITANDVLKLIFVAERRRKKYIVWA